MGRFSAPPKILLLATFGALLIKNPFEEPLQGLSVESIEHLREGQFAFSYSKRD